jgi:hypothetical protein
VLEPDSPGLRMNYMDPHSDFDISQAERFVYGWDMWERGRSAGVGHVIDKIDALIRRDVITAEQREVLVVLRDSLHEGRFR